jgi:esterase/lipase superfamily enzyme
MDLHASSPVTKRGAEPKEKSFGKANEQSPPASIAAALPSSTDHATSNRSRFAPPLPAKESRPDSDGMLDESSSAAMLMPPELEGAEEPAFDADSKINSEGIGPSVSEPNPSDAATEWPAIQPLLSADDGPSTPAEEPSDTVTVPGNESQDRSTGTLVSPPKSAAKNDTNVVRVFYGTNRRPVTSVANKTAIPLVLGGVLSVTSLVGVIIFYARSRRLTWACSTVGLCSMVLLVAGLFRIVSPAANSFAVRGYGSERGAVKYGYCDISLPPQHEFGEVERPSVFRLELREREDRHVVIKRIEEQPSKLFFAALKERVQESSQRDMFVFVHGYNVTFDNAARRTAQMAHDLGFEGAPVFFSWPSQGEFSDYTVDENTVAWTVPHLKEFLLEVVRQSDASRIHLIAHSMGNRAMTAAIRGLRQEFPHHPKFFQEIVLAAPDIDAEEFRNQIAPAIVPAAERVTLYASSNDHALMASRLIHGFSRAGESGENLIIVPGMDTIDVSRVDQSLLGHSYYGGSGPVLQDMKAILSGVSASSGRPWLLADEQNQLTYYRLDPADGLARRPN